MSSQRIDLLGVIAAGDGLWQGFPDGTSRYLLTEPCTQACWKNATTVACQLRIHLPDVWAVVEVPIDDPQNWQLVGDGHLSFGTEEQVHASNWVRAQADVILLQFYVQWPDRTLQHLPNGVYPCWVNDKGQAAYLYGEKDELVVIEQGKPDTTIHIPNGMGDDAVSGPDTSSVYPWVSARSYGAGQLLFDLRTLALVPNHIRNVDANLTRVVVVNGVPWLVERTYRPTARPFNSAFGFVLGSGDSFALDAADAILATWWTGQATAPSDWAGLRSYDPATEAMVDLLSPPLIPPLPMHVEEMPDTLTVGWYRAFHHPEWTQPEAPHPDLDPRQPCTYIFPQSQDELDYAIGKKIPCVVSNRADAERLKPLGLLWCFGARNEGGTNLQWQVDYLEPWCLEFGVPMNVYNDGDFSLWPIRWPSCAVASVNCYFAYRENIDAFRARARGILQQFHAAFPAVLVEIVPSAFDRNQSGWLPNELSNLQVPFFELAREFIDWVIGFSVWNWGRGTADLTIGGAYQHPAIGDRWIALGQALPAGPSRWPLPTEEDDMKARLTTWAEIEPELRLACHAAGFTQADTDAWVRTDYDRWSYSPAIPKPEWGLYTVPRMLFDILKLRVGIFLTEAMCVDAAGNPRTVNEILAVAYPAA